MSCHEAGKPLKFVDRPWGRTVIGLEGRHCLFNYHTNSFVVAGGEEIFFFAATEDFVRLWLCVFDLGTGRIRECSEVMSQAARQERMEEPLHALALPGERAVVMPLNDSLLKISLETGREEVIYRHPDPGTVLRGGALSPDGTRFVYGAYRNVMNEAPLNVAAIGFDALGFQPVFRVNLGRFYAGHFQFTGKPGTLLFCHEGNTLYIDDRLWLLDVERRLSRILYSHARDAETGALQECVGHEFATAGPIGSVRFPDSPGLPGGLLITDMHGGTVCVDQDDYWHCAGNPDGTKWVMDTMWWGHSGRTQANHSDIVLADLQEGTKEIIHSMDSVISYQYNHPHPRFAPDGQRVFCQWRPEGDVNKLVLMARC